MWAEQERQEQSESEVLFTVVLATVQAIKLYVELLVNQSTTNKQIYVFSKSQSVIQIFLKPSTDPKVVWQSTQALENRSKNNKVTLNKVPCRHSEKKLSN